MDCVKTTARWHEKRLSFEIWCDLYWRFYSSSINGYQGDMSYTCTCTVVLSNKGIMKWHNPTTKTHVSMHKHNKIIHRRLFWPVLPLNVLIRQVYEITCSPQYKYSTNSTVTFHEHHSDCLFNNLFRLITKDTSKLWIDSPLWWQSIDDQWIPLTKGQ